MSTKLEKYPKIRYLGDTECEGILDGDVLITEKIDGANARIAWDANKEEFIIGTRNLDYPETVVQAMPPNSKRSYGLPILIYNCIKDNKKLRSFFRLASNTIICAEYLTKHTIPYYPENYGKLYVYDIMQKGTQAYPFLGLYYIGVAEEVGLPFIRVRTEGRFTKEELKEYLNNMKSDYGDRVEGIVIRRYEFINRFGRQAHAKMVKEEFKEDFKEVWGEGSVNLTFEQKISQIYVTKQRVRKMRFLLKGEQPENYTGGMQDMVHIPKMIVEDILREHIIEISQEYPNLDFKQLRREISRETAKMLKQIVNEGG